MTLFFFPFLDYFTLDQVVISEQRSLALRIAVLDPQSGDRGRIRAACGVRLAAFGGKV